MNMKSFKISFNSTVYQDPCNKRINLHIYSIWNKIIRSNLKTSTHINLRILKNNNDWEYTFKYKPTIPKSIAQDTDVNGLFPSTITGRRTNWKPIN